jgi:hypothetical protein
MKATAGFRQSHRRTLGWLLIAFVMGCGTATTVQPEQSNVAVEPIAVEPVVGEVTLTVDFADGTEFVSLQVPCSAKSTVFEILHEAGRSNGFDVQSKGSGQTAFVFAINGVQNENGDGRNWLFRVNNELAHEGSGTYSVKPGDTIEWQFSRDKPHE